MDLGEFLKARLDEDEKQAADNLCIHCGFPTIPLRNAFGITGYSHSGGWEGRRCLGSVTGAQPVQNPARVLREVAAKRAILDLHQPEDYGILRCRGCLSAMDVNGFFQRERWPCLTIGHLAAVYSGHPDYQPEWKP